ncbi:MAG: hypothetical protein U1F68_11825 [Gammaproteobacteria bacterium]
MTKTDGVTTAVPGNSVTTITASNTGPDGVTGVTRRRHLPSYAHLQLDVCRCGRRHLYRGRGQYQRQHGESAGGNAAYTASCTISAAATGTLSTPTVTSSVTGSVPGNNSATDTDTLAPQADLAVTKADGVATATPGSSVTYAITASNAGPSNANGATRG